MARLAFGAKCGRSGSPPTTFSAAARPGSTDASAAAPIPTAPRWKKWRRVIARARSLIGVIVIPPVGVRVSADRLFWGSSDRRYRSHLTIPAPALGNELVEQLPKAIEALIVSASGV